MTDDASEPLSGGGLLDLVGLMERTVALKQTQESETGDEAVEEFAAPLFMTIDALVASEVSWKEIPGDEERQGSLLRGN